MPSLTGSKVELGLGGVPFSAETDYTKTVASGTRTDIGPITELSLWGVPGMVTGPYTGKSVATEFSFTVPVSIVPVLTLGDVTDIDLELTVVATPVLTVTASVAQTRSVDVSLVPVATWTLGGLTKTGDTAKAAAATITPVATVATSLVVQVTQDVSLIPVVTYTSGTLGISDAKLVDVSIIPATELEYQANIQLGQIAYSRSADLIPVVTVTAAVTESGDVDRIKTRVWPVGRIKTRIT